ncbi:MAG: response regulator transcription factor [Collinsella sp.]
MTANILVVEDDADINEIISTQLSRQGHTCTQAFSGTEALMRLDHMAARSLRPRHMRPHAPGATGEQIIDTVPGIDSALPVIVISARTSTADRVELLKLVQTTTSPSHST